MPVRLESSAALIFFSAMTCARRDLKSVIDTSRVFFRDLLGANKLVVIALLYRMTYYNTKLSKCQHFFEKKLNKFNEILHFFAKIQKNSNKKLKNQQSRYKYDIKVELLIKVSKHYILKFEGKNSVLLNIRSIKKNF